MSDLDFKDATNPIIVVGSTATGLETNPMDVSAKREAYTNDAIRASSLDSVVSLTTSAVELKVGVSALADRKYLIIEGLSANIKWGFSSGSQSFDLFKNQILMIPIGTAVWAKVSSGTGSIAVGEGS